MRTLMLALDAVLLPELCRSRMAFVISTCMLNLDAAKPLNRHDGNHSRVKLYRDYIITTTSIR